jgi:hypothetical protein
MMNAGKRIVPEYDPQSAGNVPLEITKDDIQASTIWTLVIPILDERIRRVLWTAYVVCGTYWK